MTKTSSSAEREEKKSSDMVKVVKFGGSSLASAEQFLKVRDIILSDPTRRYVVPSAPGKRTSDDEKVTDLLYTCVSKKNDRTAYEKTFARIAERYLDIERGLGVDAGMADALANIKQEILFQETSDYAASRGEYLNGMLLAAFLGFEFVDAARVISFNEDGTLNAPLTDIAMRNTLRHIPRAVIPGFYGATPSGRIITFSRGGSDITGSLVASGIEADIYENWTDVSGFMMADPRIVGSITPISVVTYNELRELAYMGATVMHEEAIYPVRSCNIPINIRNTNEPDDPGTRIVSRLSKRDLAERKYIVTGIAGRRGFCIITLEKNMMHNEIGFGRKVLSVLEQHKISFEHMPSGIDTLSILVDMRNIADLQQVVLDLTNTCAPDSIDVFDDIALMAVVGQGMAGKTGIAARLFRSLADSNVNIRMIDQGSSEMNIIVAVTDSDYEKAVSAAYSEFTAIEEN